MVARHIRRTLRRTLAALWLTAVTLAPAGVARAQALRGTRDSLPELPDSSDALGRARRAQAWFENRRLQLLPITLGGGGPCDEVTGRFCTWFGDGNEIPKPEPPAVSFLRDALIARLDSAQELFPGDGWLLGQRVWYRVEAGRWGEALAATARCRAERWWCAALRGLALHGLGRYREAEDAFAEALAGMDPERARRWRDLRWLLTSGARRSLERSEEQEGEKAVERLWLLADPLLLVPGNDRLTEHYARWTVAAIRENARNPFHVRWSRDLEELTVRMGWEIAWERIVNMPGADSPVGQHHPEGRDFMPGADALADPASATPADLTAGRARPRTLYAPMLAPVVLPMDAQVAAFPRGERVVVVATHFLPADTGRDVSKDALRPWMAPGDQAGEPRRAGLFLLPVYGGEPLGTESVGVEEGALVLNAPAGAYVAVVESWAPPLRRAGRLRMGLRRDTVAPDLPTLSDLLLMRGGSGEPATLEDAVLRALPRAEVPQGAPLAVAWELNGLGWRPEVVTYEISAELVGAGVLRRLGRALGLSRSERPLVLAWSEPGPERPGVVLRSVELDLGSAPAGDYAITLHVRLPGRTVLTSRTSLRVVAPPH